MIRVRAQAGRLAHNIGPLGVMIFFVALGVVIYFSIKISNQSVANGKLSAQVLSLTKTVATQSDQLTSLAEDQARNSQVGRETLKRLSDATSSSSTQTATALQQLDDAQRVGRADQLKKIAQMFLQCTKLPCDPAVVNRILAQPVPVPTFGAAPAPAPSPAAARPASTAGASVGKSSSTAAVPKPCPGPVVIQATPLVLPLLPPTQVQVCIP